MLDERALRLKRHVSYDEWLEYAAIKLPDDIGNYAAMQKVVYTLIEDRADQPGNC